MEKFKYNTIEEAIAAIKAGKMVLVTDDEDRENEGDLIMAAELCTPEAINFMAKELAASSACRLRAKSWTSCNSALW